jgi:hypothetical protein
VRFEHLRDQALALQTQPRLSPTFQQWHRDVLDTLEQAFGLDSSERRECQRMRFVLDPDVQHRGQERLRAELWERFNTRIPETFEMPQDCYYQQRLTEAAEFITSIILKLRNSGRRLLSLSGYGGGGIDQTVKHLAEGLSLSVL